MKMIVIGSFTGAMIGSGVSYYATGSAKAAAIAFFICIAFMTIRVALSDESAKS